MVFQSLKKQNWGPIPTYQEEDMRSLSCFVYGLMMHPTRLSKVLCQKEKPPIVLRRYIASTSCCGLPIPFLFLNLNTVYLGCCMLFRVQKMLNGFNETVQTRAERLGIT